MIGTPSPVEAHELFLGLHTTPERTAELRAAATRRASDLWWLNNETPRATRYELHLASGGDLRGVRRHWRRVHRATDGRLYIDGPNRSAESRRYLADDVVAILDGLDA